MTRTTPALRSELEGAKYLEKHPTVAQFFRQTGVFAYCEKLDTFHQQIAESFAVSFDGRIAKIGREEFIVDECWFKTNTPVDIEFRSYLLPTHRGMIWKKNVAMASLEPEWQALLKAIIAYITCEGRYNRAMLYQFKLLNHFTGKEEINLAFYLHKALTKMAKHVKAEPTKINSRLSHHGLITLLIKDALRKKHIEWGFFLFWNEFPTDLDKKGKKISPRISARKRRAVSIPPEEETPPSSKGSRSKKKLVFDKKTTANNPLNLPYSNSESEAEQQPTGREEQGDDLPTPTPSDEPDLAKGKQPVGADTGHQQTTEGQSPDPPSSAGPSTEPSASNDENINKLFKELHDSRHAEKQLKLKVAELIGRNVAMYDISQEMKQKFEKVLERNKMLMRDNMSMYRKVRMIRLQLQELQAPKA